MLRKILTGILWIPFIAIKFTLAALGLLVVAVAVECFGRQSSDWPKFFWVWGNDEEGCPDWWDGSAWWWYAIRNPVNNTRFIFEEPTEMTGQTNAPGGLEAHQLIAQEIDYGYRWMFAGWMSGYRSVWLNGNDKYSEFWIGWKLGSTVPGVGFTLQYRRKREIGT